jgi:hypothetical protein
MVTHSEGTLYQQISLLPAYATLRKPMHQALTTALYVDLMLPNLLLGTCRVVADSEKLPHLLYAGEQDLSRHEETDALGTRRRGETSWSLAVEEPCQH